MFADEKKYFLSKSVRLPELLIRASSLDHVDRFMEGHSYPFSDDQLKSNKGCYFFFDSYRLDGDVVDFASLYVGRTSQFNKRLYCHWKADDKFIEEYSNSVLFGDTDFDVDLGVIGTLKPSWDIKIAVWFESDERERMFLEHELIYKLRPMFNKT